MKDSYLTAGIRMGPLMRLIRKNHVSFRPKYLVRILFLLQGSIWSTLFSRIEILKYGKRFKHYPVPRDPVFIIGHWRTGSTFLHQLMSRDPLMTTPTLFQVAQPESFLTAYNYYKPLFKTFVSRHRPMDMVRLGMNEPQEDEYAIFRMTRFSPLEKLIFPDKDTYFLTGTTSYLPSPEEAGPWEQKVVEFFQKIHYQTHQRIVSKNPFHSLRIQTLVKLFPEARFVHIVRNPLDSIPSTIHMWDIVQRQNCLNRNNHRPHAAEVCDVMNDMMTSIGEASRHLPPERYAEVRFEDLEEDPCGTLKSLYERLEIPFSPEFETNIRKFLVDVSDYKKNVFHLSDEDKQLISGKMRVFMSDYHYFP